MKGEAISGGLRCGSPLFVVGGGCAGRGCGGWGDVGGSSCTASSPHRESAWLHTLLVPMRPRLSLAPLYSRGAIGRSHTSTLGPLSPLAHAFASYRSTGPGTFALRSALRLRNISTVEFPASSGQRAAVADARSRTARGSRPPRWLWRRVGLYKSLMYIAMLARAIIWLGKMRFLIGSFFKLLRKESATALSQQLPLRLMLSTG